jgi:hypothetical protein
MQLLSASARRPPAPKRGGSGLCSCCPATRLTPSKARRPASRLAAACSARSHEAAARARALPGHLILGDAALARLKLSNLRRSSRQLNHVACLASAIFGWKAASFYLSQPSPEQHNPQSMLYAPSRALALHCIHPCQWLGPTQYVRLLPLKWQRLVRHNCQAPTCTRQPRCRCAATSLTAAGAQIRAFTATVACAGSAPCTGPCRARPATTPCGPWAPWAARQPRHRRAPTGRQAAAQGARPRSRLSHQRGALCPAACAHAV